MNRQELIDLLNVQCVAVFEDQDNEPLNARDVVNVPGVAEVRSIPTIQIRGVDKTQGVSVIYRVLNPGKVAGPQVYAEDVLDEDGITVLHAAGDPVLDEDGNQVVLSEAEAEQATFVSGQPDLPVDKNALGMQFLASKVLDGTIAGFELLKSRPDLGIFSFFEAEVFVPVIDAETGNPVPWTVRKELWRVQEGPESVIYYTIVT